MRRVFTWTVVLSVLAFPGTLPARRSPAVPPALPAANGRPALDFALASLRPGTVELRESPESVSFQAGNATVELRRDAPVVATSGLTLAAIRALKPAETRDGLVLYRGCDEGSALVYRPTATGIKEDLVLLDEGAFGAGVFGWWLGLEEGFESRLEEDGSIGIYGAGGELSSVNVCDSKSAELVAKMKARAGKTRLVARIPAPVSHDADGRPLASSFRLGGGLISVEVARPARIAWPVTVDPTIVLTLDADFRLAGNDEGLVRFGTDQVHRDKTTGGNVPSWASAGCSAVMRWPAIDTSPGSSRCVARAGAAPPAGLVCPNVKPLLPSTAPDQSMPCWY